MTTELADHAATENTERNRRQLSLLLVLPFAPRSLEKCAHLLILERCQELGWSTTVLVADTEGAPTVQANGSDQVSESDWHGLRILRVGSNSWRRRVGEQIHRLRPADTQRQIKFAGVTLPRILTRPTDLMLRPLSWAITFPDHFVAFANEFCAEAIKRHRQAPFDAVASFYHPFSSHLIARRISQAADIPWVAFSQDFYSWPKDLTVHSKDRVFNVLKKRHERSVLTAADVVVAYSDNLLDYLQSLVPGTPVKLLPHCYDDEDFPTGGEAPAMPSDSFCMLSTGLVAKTEEPGLREFFDAVQGLLADGEVDPDKFRIRFVGHGGDIVRDCAKAAGCLDVVQIEPPMRHDQAMLELKQATCLLYQQSFWGMRRRLPEYFGARKPILAFPSYPKAMSQRLLNQYGAARVARDKEAIKAAILDWYEQFLATGTVQADVNEPLVQEFRASNRASELKAILQDVVGDKA